MRSPPPRTGQVFTRKNVIIIGIVLAAVLILILLNQRETLFGKGAGTGTISEQSVAQLALARTSSGRVLPTFQTGFTINPENLINLKVFKNIVSVCGNGILEGREQCEDRNTVAGDGCTNCVCERGTVVATCRAFCGDSIVTRPEECDDGNTNPADGCDPLCRIESWYVEVPAPPPPLTCYSCAAGGAGCTAMTLEAETCTPFYGESTCGGECGVEISTEVPPTDADRERCAQPNPFDLPPGTRYRDFPDSRHISICETETSARYIICGSDGTVTVNVESCSTGVSCTDGACTDDSRWRGVCWDSDGGSNPGTRGEVRDRLLDGEERIVPDFCSGLSLIQEYFCIDDERRSHDFYSCEVGTHCEEGLCVPGGITCDDPDGTDIHTAGTATNTAPDGTSSSRSDVCAFSTEAVHEVICNPLLNDITISFFPCPSGERCEDGRCVPGEPYTVTCDDPDGLDRTIRGTTILRRSDGYEASYTDRCSDTINGVLEVICVPGSDVTTREVYCLDTEYCDAGRCVAGCRCTRTDATADRGGYVRGSNCIEQPDICEGDFLHMYRCDTDASSSTYSLPIEDASRSSSCPAGCDTTRGRCR